MTKKHRPEREQWTLYWPMAALLLLVWVLGQSSGHTLGGLVHLLLAVAVVMVLVGCSLGRRLS